MSIEEQMINVKNKDLFEKLKKIIEDMNQKNSVQLTLPFDEVNAVIFQDFTQSGIVPQENITKMVNSKLTYIIRDITSPKHNPHRIDLDSIRPGTCLIVYAGVDSSSDTNVNLYYNKTLDKHTYHKITGVNDSNFSLVANCIHKHYLKFLTGVQSNVEISLINHYYDTSKNVHLYTIPMEVLFHLELNSTPYPVCKYYTSFQENIVSNEYEYFNNSHIYTCSNPVMKKQQKVINPERPCPCPYDKSISQLSCGMYEPSSTFEISAFSNSVVNNPIVTKVVLKSFKDRNTKEKFYTVDCDDSESFKFTCKDEEANDIFSKIVSDLTVEGQSFIYSTENIEKVSPKKKISSFIKNIIGLEKQNV